MSGESVLIVDDTTVNLKLTRILLAKEGYKVLTAGSAEEAQELLRSHHPQLILADIQLPGMDGLELTRRIRRDETTRDIIVIALTAFAMKGDEQKAIDAGCDGYITKPIDTRTLGARIRDYLSRRTEAQATNGSATVADADSSNTMTHGELQAIRRRFLSEGQECARQMLLDLEGQFDANAAAFTVHQWIGAAGLLGYSATGRLAREVEAVLLERPVDNALLRGSLTDLALAFTTPRDARGAALPKNIAEVLHNQRIALVALPAHEAQRLCVALERVHAVPVFFDAAQQAAPEVACDLAVVHVSPETVSSQWLDPERAASPNCPLVLVGSRDDLTGLDPRVQRLAREFLMDAWQPEEALVRLNLALGPRPATASRGCTPAADDPVGRARIVVADADPVVVALVCATLHDFGMECRTAVDGPSALEAVQEFKPQAAVLDVHMPGMDGYAILAALRSEEIPVRVLLLTARQQENDVIRGFALGAGDYVAKPFSPTELVARMKWLLAR